MNDWIGLAVVVVLVLCGLFALSRLGKPYDVSAEEFERRAQEGPGLISAGLIGLQKILDPAAERAAVVQEELKQGRYNKEDGSGDPPDGGDDHRELSDDNTGDMPQQKES